MVIHFDLGKSAINNWQTVIIAIIGFAVLSFYFKKLNTAFVIIGGALIGYLLMFLR